MHDLTVRSCDSSRCSSCLSQPWLRFIATSKTGGDVQGGSSRQTTISFVNTRFDFLGLADALGDCRVATWLAMRRKS